MYVIDIVIVICWAAFWIYWLVASVGVKSGRISWGRFAGSRVAIFLIILLLVRLRFFKGRHMVVGDPFLQGIGLAIVVLGLALAIWARGYLGRNWGMPMTEKANPELVTAGPYAAIRHPIYSGLILALLGTAVAVSLYFLIGFAVLGGYFIYSAVMEERYMAGIFPDAYPRYKQETKMLIPYIV
jgi:protein-S-isoprenylcysteine O-methyltransferase Ste14